MKRFYDLSEAFASSLETVKSQSSELYEMIVTMNKGLLGNAGNVSVAWTVARCEGAPTCSNHTVQAELCKRPSSSSAIGSDAGVDRLSQARKDQAVATLEG